MRITATITCLAILPIWIPPSGLALSAERFKVTLRPHVSRIVLGDPLYAEVTILNDGDAPESGPQPHPELGTLAFAAYGPYDPNQPNSDRAVTPRTLGGRLLMEKTIQFEPGKPHRFYAVVFLPGLRHLDDPFWQAALKDGRILLGVNYRSGETVLGSSGAKSVQLIARDPRELRALDQWQRLTPQPEEMGPGPGEFGLEFARPLNRNQTAGIAAEIKTGELADLLRVTVRMQDIYAKPASQREAETRALVEWLSKQPDVMAKTLAGQAKSVALRHQMSATAQALDEILNSRD